VSCPYFYPVEPADADGRAALLPLGNLWAGVCRAVTGYRCEPDQDSVRTLCHLGYARGHCRHFPAADTGADAVRFTIRRDDGRALHLYYVLERDHLPFAHGALEYSLDCEAFTQPPLDTIVLRQAEAYVASYRRRKRSL